MIDWDRVAELRDEVGPDDFGEVVELFLDEVEAVLHRLAGNPQPAAYEEDFHFLKGSALNLGFAEFGALCFAAEKAASEGRGASIDVAQVLAAYAISKDAFMERADALGIAA